MINQRGPRCHDHGIAGYGDPSHEVFLLGISPGRDETRTGKPMTGQSGQLMDNILEATGWHRDKTYATNIVCYECKAPTFQEIMDCRPRLQEEIKQFRPKLVVCLGEPVGSLFFPNKKYGNVRGAIDWYAQWGTFVLPTYHPAAILYGSSELVTRSIVRDFLKIREFFNYPPRPQVEFEAVLELDKAKNIMNNLPKDRMVTLDVESDMDKEEDETTAVANSVVCFSISYVDNDGVERDYWFPGSFITQLTWPLDLVWTFQNGMFDTIELSEAIGILLPIKHDTMYMSYVLDERGGVHGLKSLGREYEAAGFWEDRFEGKKWKDKLKETKNLQRYNATDAAMTLRLGERLLRRVDKEGMRPVYDELIAAANIYRHMQQTGIPVNKERYTRLLGEYIPLRELHDVTIKQKIGELGGDPNINLASPKQLGEFLYGILRLPGGPSTAAPILEALVGEHPFIEDLLDLRHLDKAINTYIVGAWNDIKRTGRIHPTPKLHSQVSNRVSYGPYSVNTLPRSTSDNPYLARLRWMFTAPDDDYVILVVDYSQAEIWMAYTYSQDPQMLTDLRSGDFHRANAAWIFGVPSDQVSDSQRSDAKRTTFGNFFGIGDYKLAAQTNKTLEEARFYKQSWAQRYPKYIQYTKDMFQEARDEGELRTLCGRLRRFPIVIDTSIVNKAINYKIQTTAHSCLMKSIVQGYWMVRDLGAYPIIDWHDAWVIIAKRSNVSEVAKRVIDLMQQPKYDGVMTIPAEAKWGFSLGETNEKVVL